MSGKERASMSRKEAESRSKFETARKQLQESGAIDLMERVARSLPNASLTIIDDYDEQQFLNVVVCDVGDREEHLDRKNILGKRILASTTTRELRLSPLWRIYPSVTGVEAWSEELQEIEGEEGHSRFGSEIWREYGTVMSDLAPSIREGIAQLYPGNLDIQRKVEEAISPAGS